MKKTVMTGFLAIGLFIPALTFAQSGQMQDDKNSQAQQNQAAQVDQSGSTTQPKQSMTGMVSDGGKTFTSGTTTYTVSNPNSLKNYDSQTVSVRFLFNTGTNTVRILKVNPGQ
jgi:hypothetical protein